MAKPTELRIRVIEAVKTGKPIIAVSQDYGVSARTVRRWLKKYKDGGLKRLTQPRPYIRPWNVTPDKIARKIYLLKEKEPEITLSQARKKLSDRGMPLSLACIRKIWQRYGLAGFFKERETGGLIPGIPLSKDVEAEINNAIETLSQKGDAKAAAKILNKLPYCGGAEILDKIPYQHLGLRRKVEKVAYLLGREPLHETYKRTHSLRVNLEKKDFFYSALRAGIAEANALFWMGKPRQTVSLMKRLEKKLPKQGDPMICFMLFLYKGMALSRLLELNDAAKCAKECKRLVRMLPDASYRIGVGNLYSNMGMYLQAKDYFAKAIQDASDTTRDQCLLSLAGCYALNGEYQNALSTIKELEQRELPAYTFMPLVRAQAFLGQGMLTEAAKCANDAIGAAKKNEVLQYLHTATMVLAAIYCALGEKKRTGSLIQSMLPLLKKNRMIQDYYIRRLFLAKSRMFVPKKYQNEPFIKLILLMKKAAQTLKLKDYNQAMRFAANRGLLGHFHRLCIFNSNVVLNLMEKGKPLKLPMSILNIPIFSKNLPVLCVNFLGPLTIQRNETSLKTDLRPKDAAFLVYMLMNKSHRILLEETCRNFWPRSSLPSKNLTHLLVRMRKTLLIPSHLLKIKRDFLVWDFYLNSDYGYFDEILIQAKALERAGEWGFARKEYLRAFKLFRGEPLKRNYDEWSLNMRHKILTQLEEEAKNFTRSCLEHKNKSDARKVLEKVLRIIPDSEEIQSLVNSV